MSLSNIKNFIPLTIFLILVIVLYNGLSLDKNTDKSIFENRDLPRFSLKTIDGLDVDDKVITNLNKDKTYLIHFWATWCNTCTYDHDYLISIKSKYPNVDIVSVNYKDDKIAVKSFLGALKNPYSILIDDNEGNLGIDLGVVGTPTTFLLKDNKILKVHSGMLNSRIWNRKFAIFLSN